MIRQRALSEWEEANPGAVYDPEMCWQEILPKLATTVKPREIVEATGLPKGYASTIRAGKFAPHVSAWSALGELVGVEVAKSAAQGADRHDVSLPL
jgi:hypothetical protein